MAKKIEYKTDPKTGMAIIPKKLPKGLKKIKYKKVLEISGLSLVQEAKIEIPIEGLQVDLNCKKSKTFICRESKGGKLTDRIVK